MAKVLIKGGRIVTAVDDYVADGDGKVFESVGVWKSAVINNSALSFLVG